MASGSFGDSRAGARAIWRCTGGGIILSSVAIRYQLGLVFQAGSSDRTRESCNAPRHLESAMNAAFTSLTSAANEARNFALSRNR